MSVLESLALSEMLSESWEQALAETIGGRDVKDLKRFLGKERAWTIPARANTFAALRGRDAPHLFNVVVIGQDPYPRESSAVGIAFNDGEIKKWTDKLNPSFTNIIKSMMIHEKKLPEGGDIKALREAAKKHDLVDPPGWFEHTQRQGVMWLNTALTFSSKDLNILKEHTTFWRPIVMGIFKHIIEAKKEAVRKSKGAKEGLVFIMWGGYAQKFRKEIEQLNAASEPALPIEFVENNHPAATGNSLLEFFKNNSFTAANAALQKMGLEPVKWFATSAEASKEAAAASAPAPSSTAAKEAAGKNAEEKEDPNPRKRKAADAPKEAAPGKKTRGSK